MECVLVVLGLSASFGVCFALAWLLSRPFQVRGVNRRDRSIFFGLTRF